MEHGSLSTPVTSDPAFEDFYRSALEPLAEPAEARRRFAIAESRQRRKASAVALTVGTVLVGASLSPGLAGYWFFFAVAVVMAGVVLGTWAWWPLLGRGGKQTTDVATRLAPFYGDLEYRRQVNLDLARYRAWSVLPKFDHRQARGQIRGSYRGVPLSITEVSLSKRVRQSGQGSSGTTTVPVFEGLFCDFRLSEPCRATTVFGSAGMFEESFERSEPDLVARGRPTYGFDYEVYSSDQEESRRLVSRHLVDALGKISSELGAERLTGSFHDDRLLLLVEREKPDLDPPPEAETDLRRHAETVRAYLARVLGLVEALPLEPSLEPDETVVQKHQPETEASSFEAPDRFEGWGCLFGLVTYAVLVSAVGWVARGRVDDAWLPGVAGSGALLMTIGGLAVYRLVKRIFSHPGRRRGGRPPAGPDW